MLSKLVRGLVVVACVVGCGLWSACESAMAQSALVADAVEDQGPTPGGPVLWQSGTRIRARVGVTPDGARMFLGWWDKDLGMNCGFEKAVDGVVRCLPMTMIHGAGRYADADCTVRIAAVLESSEDAPLFALHHCGKDPAEWCYFRVGGPYSGPMYELVSGSPCRQADPPGRLAHITDRLESSIFQSRAEVTE